MMRCVVTTVTLLLLVAGATAMPQDPRARSQNSQPGQTMQDIQQLLQRALLQQAMFPDRSKPAAWGQQNPKYPDDYPGQTMEEDGEQLLQRALLQQTKLPSATWKPASPWNPAGPWNPGATAWTQERQRGQNMKDIQQLLQRALLQQRLPLAGSRSQENPNYPGLTMEEDGEQAPDGNDDGAKQDLQQLLQRALLQQKIVWRRK